MNDDREPVGKAFTASLLTHAVALTLLATSGLWFHNSWGSEHASSGSVGVSMVKTIPIPRREGAVNPLANDTKSVVPQEQAPAKPQKVVEAPKDAVAIPRNFDKPKKAQAEPKLVFKPPAEYKDNQIFSHTPQAASTNMYGTQGTGGIDIGPASVLGARFGGYVDLMRDRISQHWVTADVKALPSQVCAITFTIARNGAVSNVQVSQSSGNYLLDTSAKRAVIDANPLPPLPAEVPQNEATVELKFQLHQ